MFNMFQNASARPSLQTGAAPGAEFCDLWRIIPKITGAGPLWFSDQGGL